MMVFSNGEWVEVFLPKGYDPCWMPANKQFYATMWAAAIQKHNAKRAEVVAEAATTKQLYPDISYDKSLESDIKSLFE